MRPCAVDTLNSIASSIAGWLINDQMARDLREIRLKNIDDLGRCGILSGK